MEYIRLQDINLKEHIGERVFLVFLTRDVSVRTQKDKVTQFVTFNMADKDLLIEARLFGATPEQIELIKEGKVYNAAVDVKPYDKSPSGYSCIIYNIDNSDVDPKIFADWAENLQESRNAIDVMIRKYYGNTYSKIAYPILVRHWEKFVAWTAASGMHHTQLGGLITHTAEVIETCELIGAYYNNRYKAPIVNIPLLVWSALLHDIGKTTELDVNIASGKVEYSKLAVLSTHIMDILSEVEREIVLQKLGEQTYSVNEPDESLYENAYMDPDDSGDPIPQKSDEQIAEEIESCMLLKHCLAAHHGKLEWGSPIVPAVPEAMILHIMDMISAEMFRFNKNLKNMEVANSQSIWMRGTMMNFYKDITKEEL